MIILDGFDVQTSTEEIEFNKSIPSLNMLYLGLVKGMTEKEANFYLNRKQALRDFYNIFR